MFAIKHAKQSNYKILAMEVSKQQQQKNIPSICISHVKIWQQTALSVEKLFVLEIHTVHLNKSIPHLLVSDNVLPSSVEECKYDASNTQ